MERRLLTFIVASTAFFLCYAWLRFMFVEPVANPDPNAVAEVREQPAEPAAVAAPADVEIAADDQPVPERPQRPAWITLGSMDPALGYNLLVTLNSRGGGIERIELTERNQAGDFKYRRVDIYSGYLGYFAGESTDDNSGVLVNVVAPGTPAERAGVQVGDVIVAVAGSAVASPGEIEAALKDTKPGDDVSVEVVRQSGAGPAVLTATLTEHPLDLVRLARYGGVNQIPGNLSRLSCLLTLGHVNAKSILPNERSINGLKDPTEMIWNSATRQQDRDQIAEFSVELSAAEMQPVGGAPVRLKRAFTVRPGSYAIDMSVQVDNLSDQPQNLAYRLEGANGITLEGWWYSYKRSPNWGGAAARDVIYNTQANHHQLISGVGLLDRSREQAANPDENIFAPDQSDEARKLKYIAVDSLYFAVGYVPPVGLESMTEFRNAAARIVADAAEVPRHKERAVNTTFYLDSVVSAVPAGGSIKQDLQLFAGPKQPELLDQFGLGQAVYYGWFSAFAKVLAWLLHKLSAVGNYAMAIIILTILVRASMFPLSRKAAVNAQKMQELAPEMKKITEKYKDDMEGKLKAQRELQQRVGFNPLAGCLPMFLQLPIFIGLYSALSADIELRQAAFSSATDWASNLAAPDMFAYWGDWLWDYLSGRGTGWLGPYFNILPVIVVVLFLAQQKMFMPPATDEQTAMTQKMMNIMTLMMGLFFFRVPAGLCIYFITSSLWGICERILVKKTLPSGNHFDPALLNAADAPAPREEKSQSLAERIRSQVAKPDEPAVRPNKRKRPPQKKK